MTLWDGILPEEVKLLPTRLQGLDRTLSWPQLLEPFRTHWGKVLDWGRPSIPMEVYLRLMVVKQENNWGYEELRERVSDSIHLRRFCHLQLTEALPHESTVRKPVALAPTWSMRWRGP